MSVYVYGMGVRSGDGDCAPLSTRPQLTDRQKEWKDKYQHESYKKTEITVYHLYVAKYNNMICKKSLQFSDKQNRYKI